MIDYADHHSGTVATQPTRVNPYKLGLELFKDIEDRWNKGKFGKDYEECDSIEEKKDWDKNLGLGREKIFEVRRIYNDVTFIDTFLTEEFCHAQKMFAYKFDPEQNAYVISGRDFKKVKQQLLFSLTNFGQPLIYVREANYENRGRTIPGTPPRGHRSQDGLCQSDSGKYSEGLVAARLPGDCSGGSRQTSEV